ncbi:MAG: GWxTD domain-containing protein [Bacteroidota bacterium]
MRVIQSFVVFLAILLAVSCSGPSKLSNVNLAYRYSSGLSFAFPSYHAIAMSGDSMKLLFEVSADELLFVNNDSLATASFSISYIIYKDEETKSVIDSGVTYYTHAKMEGNDGRVRGVFVFFAPDSSNHVMRVDFSDQNRRQSVTDFVYLDRTGIQPESKFMLVDVASNTPLIRNNNDRELAIRITHQGGGNPKPVYMRYFKGRYPIADPPFSDNPQKVLSYAADETYLVGPDEVDPIVLSAPGIYHFQYDTLVSEGYSFFIFNEDFPRLTNISGLIESVRYLTTKEEFAHINSSKNIRAAIDEFWLSKAGNRERARELIKAYYTRVQTANRLFSSYMEGWKTDRGLIYVIFGSPGTVYRSTDTETWLYSQTTGQPTLSFVFEKKRNPFTPNDYMLRRSSYFDIPWYRAVETWRDGRIYNDSY